MYLTLEHIRDQLESIKDVQTCRIGIENAISPDDYPIIRVVPSRASHGATLTRKRLDVLIYFGVPISESEEGGLEAVYAALCAMEDEIIVALESSADFTAVWQDTVTDEDRLEAYKLFASRFTVVA